MLDGIGNKYIIERDRTIVTKFDFFIFSGIVTLMKNMIPSNVDDHQPQQLPDDIPCMNKNPMV